MTADLTDDCFSATPLKAPKRTSMRTPITTEAVTAYHAESKIRGIKSTRDARAEVKAITIPDTSARRLILPIKR